ncbi:MAG: universal stress protein [Candidatus Paralactobacillus gallistercoris]|uniref:Universal stress protein n=1 Tax=Candidatus Paralactobacillus gallistercoris TaxID=2838724 RepID=A0A948TJ71_9LACO|nr:universal stress protein [Candidatus Paralactobacillus gallistercoris]
MAKTEDDFEVKTLQFNKLLLAVDDDDDESSQKAFDYACTLAKTYNVALGIVSILETGDMNVYQSLSSDFLDKRRAEMMSDLNTYVQKAREYGVQSIEPIIGEGSPGRVIVDEIIPTFQPDLVIVGSHTNPMFSRRHLGMQASYIARNASVSVIIVR